MVTNMPSAQAMDEATIFDVIADRARSRSTRFLGTQAGVTLTLAIALAVVGPTWWPLAALLLAVGAYSGWGLLDACEQRTATPLFAIGKRALVVVAIVASVAAVAGTALAAFAGDSLSPYGVCYGPNGRAFACESRGRAR